VSRSSSVEWIYPSSDTAASDEPTCLSQLKQPLLGGVTELSRGMSPARFSRVPSISLRDLRAWMFKGVSWYGI